MATKVEKKKVFDDGAYDRAMAHGDKHEVAIDKGWGKKPEGASKNTAVDPEV